jgi:hypothetical protein
MNQRNFQPRTFIGLDGRARTRLVRHFKVGGEDWTVYEEPTAVPVLIFEADHVARRVRSYPPNWSELADEELYVLSWSS